MRSKTFVALLTSAVVAALSLAGTSEAQEAGTADGRAKNVIIFVGDGMGTSHRDLIRYATVGTAGQLAMDSMPYAGRSETSPLDPEALITDSAAGGTAISTGVKTFNGAVGVDVDGRRVPTVLEQARDAGKATGLVTDSQVTDATPASFGAHVEDRDEQSEIARQFIEESQPDVILGGGEDYWFPEENDGAFPDRQGEDEEVSQSDQGNLVAQAQDRGYEYVKSGEELSAAQGDKLLGLFANEETFQQAPEGEGDEYDPTVPLPAMTRKAIEVLSQNPEGFFLLVEGEGVDEMAHQSNAGLVIKAGQALDRAVEVGKSYAETDPGTLVIVAADHETGSLAIEDTNEIQSDPDYPNESGGGRTTEDGPFRVAGSDKSFLVDWSTTNHTAEDVPVTAMGPGGEELVGVYENTHIHDAMVQALLGTSATSASTSASASASASASPTASASASASAVPDTGGPTVAPWLVAGSAGFALLGLFVSLRVLRGTDGNA